MARHSHCATKYSVAGHQFDTPALKCLPATDLVHCISHGKIMSLAVDSSSFIVFMAHNAADMKVAGFLCFEVVAA